MICLNALSQDNHLNVNITLAQSLGLQTAVYWAALSNVLPRVMKKKTFDKDGFFEIDRKYIRDKSTLSLAEQRKCDLYLVEFGILTIDPNNENRIRVDSQAMLNLIVDGNVKEIKKIVKAVEKEVKQQSKQPNKAELIKNNMKRFIIEQDQSLVDAYNEWIDIMAENRKITKLAVEKFQEDLKPYNNEIKLKIIKLASSHVYLDACWAIDIYNKQQKANVQQSLSSVQKVGTTVNNEIEF